MRSNVRVALGTWLLACLAAAPAEAQWRRLDSPNFVVIGDVSAGVLRDVTARFEGFREVLGHLLGERLVATAVPTVVVVFQSDHVMAPFRPKYQGKPVDVAGLFLAGGDVNYIAMVDDGNPARLRVVFHEYFHLVTANAGQTLPVWLSEGLAEFYSTFEAWSGGREAEVGKAVREHLALLQDEPLIPLAELVAAGHESPLYNEGNRRSVFYAQAWALAHMMLTSEPSRTPQLTTYLSRVWSGVPAAQAWAEAFGDSNVQRELEIYVRRRSFQTTRVSVSDAATQPDARPVAIPQADVQVHLADLLLRLDDFDAAAARLAQATKLDAANARATVSTARLDLARGQTDGGQSRLNDMATPDDWFLAYLAGAAAAELIEKRGGIVSPVDLNHVRRFFAASRAGRPEFANAVARVASLELRTEAGPAAETAAALGVARQRAPGRHDYAFLHAQVLARQQEFGQARSALGPFMTSAYPADVRTAARNLMGFIVEMEQARQRGGRPATGAAPPGPPGSSSTDTTTLGSPDFRRLQPGEERLEGTLERLECVEGQGVIFHVRTGDAVVTALAPSLSNVDFITYRDDLRGSVTCGPFTPAMAVYLTWRKSPDVPGTKIVLAVEFLPRRE